MFRIIELDDHGVATQPSVEVALAPPTGTTLRWIDLTAPTPDELERLRLAFGLDPLAVTDCASYGRQPKVDEYDSAVFVVLHAFSVDQDPLDIAIHELHAFLGENFLITVHEQMLPAVQAVWARSAAGGGILARGPSWALYTCAEAMVKLGDPLVEQLVDELDTLERAVIEDEQGAVDISAAFRVKRTSMSLRRVLRPMRDALRLLHRRTDGRVSPRASLYFRDLADHVQRQADTVDETREVAVGVVASYQALLGARTNEAMKRLTVFSAVFLPLGVIVGFWGQNFSAMPFDNSWAFAFMLVSLVVVPVGLMEWFRKNWL